MAREQMLQSLIQSHNEVVQLMAEAKTKESKIQDYLEHLSLEQGVLLTKKELTPEVIIVPRGGYAIRIAILRAQKMPEFGFLMFRDTIDRHILPSAESRQIRRIHFLPDPKIAEVMKQYDQGYVVADPEMHVMFRGPLARDPNAGEEIGTQMMQVVESIIKAALYAAGHPIEFVFVRHAEKMNEIVRDRARLHNQIDCNPPVWFCEVDEFRSRMQRRYGRDIVQDALSFIDWERSNIEERGLKDEFTAVPFLEISGCIR